MSDFNKMRKFEPLTKAQLRIIRLQLPDNMHKSICTRYGVRSLEQLSKNDAFRIISQIYKSNAKTKAKKDKIE